MVLVVVETLLHLHNHCLAPCPGLCPAAVREQELARAAGGKVYVHCTAGLGRSPAVAIASLYWFTDMQLDEAYAYLTGIRPCGPNKVCGALLRGAALHSHCTALHCAVHLASRAACFGAEFVAAISEGDLRRDCLLQSGAAC